MSTSGCGHAIEYIYNYLDDEITWTRRMRVRWHLRKCNHCCDAFEFETHLKTVIREKGQDEPPPELMDRLKTLLREEGFTPPSD